MCWIACSAPDSARAHVPVFASYQQAVSGVQGGALMGTAYSNSQRLGHHKAGEGTRVGSALGPFRVRLVCRVGTQSPHSSEREAKQSRSGDRTLVCTIVLVLEPNLDVASK